MGFKKCMADNYQIITFEPQRHCSVFQVVETEKETDPFNNKIGRWRHRDNNDLI